MKRKLAGVVAAMCMAVALCSCLPQFKLDANASVQSDGDAYVVLGARPDNYLFWIRSGDIVSGRFVASSRDWVLGHAIWKAGGIGYPDSGYIVMKVIGGRTIAITNIQYENRIGLLGPLLQMCNTLVFTVPTGKVVYVGDIDFSNARYSYGYDRIELASSVRPTWRFEAARIFLSQRYPSLANVVEEGHSDMMPTDQCPDRQ